MRLTNDMRDQICGKVIKHRFGPTLEKIGKQQADLAHRIYCTAFSKSEREIMDSLPDGWVPMGCNIRATVGGRVFNYSFNGDFKIYGKYLPLRTYQPVTERPFPFNKNCATCLAVLPDEPLGKDMIVFLERIERTVVEIKEATNKVSVTLKKFTTVEKLVEAWPEVKPFTKGVAPEVIDRSLPMIPVDTLNQMLDLPCSE